MSDRRARSKGRKSGGTFIMLRHKIVDSPQFFALSTSSIKLLLDLLRQYRGTNNGDLSIAWSIMKDRGWVSRQTLQRARDELIELGFIQLSRQGGRRKPSLYALTFHPVDYCGGKLEISATKSASNDWRKIDPVSRKSGQCDPIAVPKSLE